MGVPVGTELLHDADSRWLESATPGEHLHGWIYVQTAWSGWREEAIACSMAEIVPWSLFHARERVGETEALGQLARRYQRLLAKGEVDFAEIVRAADLIFDLPAAPHSAIASGELPSKAAVAHVTESFVQIGEEWVGSGTLRRFDEILGLVEESSRLMRKALLSADLPDGPVVPDEPFIIRARASADFGLVRDVLAACNRHTAQIWDLRIAVASADREEGRGLTLRYPRDFGTHVYPPADGPAEVVIGYRPLGGGGFVTLWRTASADKETALDTLVVDAEAGEPNELMEILHDLPSAERDSVWFFDAEDDTPWSHVVAALDCLVASGSSVAVPARRLQ